MKIHIHFLKKSLFLLFVMGGALAAQASYLPFFDGIRAAIVERQVAVSNGPSIGPVEKKELNTLKVALKNVNKSSTSLKSDLTILAAVVKGINKGASNETFAFELRTAVSNYVDVLVATNDTLEEILLDANNNPTLKEKATTFLETAQAALAAVDPENDLNAAGKALGAVLKRYLSATKAVLAAANAQPTPLPAPRAGTLVVEVNGQRLTFGAQFPLRNATATGLVGEGSAPGSSSTLIVHIPSNGGPGTYNYGLIFTDTIGGNGISFSAGGEVIAEVTKASSSALVGSISGTAQVRINGGAPENMPFTCRFNGKKFSFLP